jgi:septum formation protein
MDTLYLASGSPRRVELLQQLGYAFEQVLPEIVEQQQPNESPPNYVQRLAREKALAGVKLARNPWPVLGADTIVVLDNRVLEKPVDEEQAVAMLSQLANRTHHVLTSVALATKTGINSRLVTTAVTFCPLQRQQILDYVATGEPMDKAGAYAIQGLAGAFIRHIDGSYYAVMGLPLVETRELIEQHLGISNDR